MHCAIISPEAMSSAANNVVVPCRTQWWVTPSTYPSPMGKSGWVRSSACVWLFSSHTKHDRRIRRVQILSDNVVHFLCEEGIVGQLEVLLPVGRNAQCGPDALHF